MALGEDLHAVQAEALQALELEVAGQTHAAISSYTRATSQMQYLLDVCVPESQPDLAGVCRGLLGTWRARLQVHSVHSVGAAGARGIQAQHAHDHVHCRRLHAHAACHMCLRMFHLDTMHPQVLNARRAATLGDAAARAGMQEQAPHAASQPLQAAASQEQLHQPAAGGGDAAGAADDVMGSQHPGCWVHMDAAAAAAAALEHGAAFYDGSAGSTCDVLPAQPAAAAAAAAAARLVACMAAGGSALMPPHMTAWERGGSGGEGGGAAGACGGSGGAHSAAKLELLRACQRDVAGTLDDVVGHE